MASSGVMSLLAASEAGRGGVCCVGNGDKLRVASEVERFADGVVI